MMSKSLISALAALAVIPALTACGVGDAAVAAPAPSSASAAANSSVKAAAKHTPTPIETGTPAAKLAATAWETTSAKNAEGASVPLTDENVKSYVGYAYFNTDGTFVMNNLDDTPKMNGDWAVSADGKTRTLWAKNADGTVKFSRVVPIVTLDAKEFTYRVYPKAEDKAVYFDLIHTPTTHAQPQR